MTTKAKSDARRFLEKLRGGPLTFGEMLKSFRLADEVSQTELATKMGMSRAHLCDIENGRRAVNLDKAAHFAKVLGYSEKQFMAVAIEDQLRNAGFRMRVLLKAA
jgi:antitoxin HigA-1